VRLISLCRTDLNCVFRGMRRAGFFPGRRVPSPSDRCGILIIAVSQELRSSRVITAFPPLVNPLPTFSLYGPSAPSLPLTVGRPTPPPQETTVTLPEPHFLSHSFFNVGPSYRPGFSPPFFYTSSCVICPSFPASPPPSSRFRGCL